MKKAVCFIGFLLTVFSSQSIWITFAPVSSLIAERLALPTTSIGLLAVVYPVVFLLLSLPSGRLIDRNAHTYLIIASLLTALGAVGRFIADALWVWYICQILAAVAQPFILNAFVPVANTLLPEKRGMALSAMSMAMYGGMAFSLLSGSYLYDTFGLAGIFWPSAVTSSLGLIFVLLGNKALLLFAPEAKVFAEKFGWREIFTFKEILLLGFVLGLGVGTFDNLSTWLEPALHNTDTAHLAGSIMGATIGAGILSVAVTVPIIIRRTLHIAYLMFATLFVGISMLILSVYPVKVWIAILLLASGAIMFPAYPVILELIALRFKNPGLATGAVGMVSRVVTVALTLSAAFFISGAGVFFRFLSIPVMLGFVLVLFYKKNKR